MLYSRRTAVWQAHLVTDGVSQDSDSGYLPYCC